MPLLTPPPLPLPADIPALDDLAALARAAGALILQVYQADFQVQHKADDSPVTVADARAEALIVDGLRRLAPGWPIVAEEAVSAGEAVQAGPLFWLVDPLDGTREFVQRNGEFTVNIALVQAGVPVLGVVLAPVTGHLYAGILGQGAWRECPAGPASAADGAEAVPQSQAQRQPLRCRPVPPEGQTVVMSRSHGDTAALDAYLARERVARRVAAGSSLKLCLLAAGEADLYPRFGRTMEWDIAAGHAVLAAAGGQVRTLDGAPLRYGKPGFENPDFVARGH